MVYHRSEGSGSRSDRNDRNRASQPSGSQPGTGAAARNAFRNDGSFLAMFKKMQEAKSEAPSVKSEPLSPSKSGTPGPAYGSDLVAVQAPESRPALGPESSAATAGAKKPQPLVGKRRGGRVLPTGVVKKKRTDEDDDDEKPKDAWSLYMAEVRRYKETSCEEDGKTRPLVK